MRLTLVAALSLLLAPGCSVSETSTQNSDAPARSEFVPLFDPGELTGWVQVLDSKWVLRDGVLLARQDPNGRLSGESWLLTERDYEDFILKVRFRITPGGNSGVFVRDPIPRQQRIDDAEGGKPPPWEAGYEVNINNDEPNYPTGSIWATAKGPPKLQREGEWNDLEVKIQGTRIWTWINGKPAIDGVELPPRAAKGAIGFQRHGGEAYRDKLIEFKDIRIKEL